MVKNFFAFLGFMFVTLFIVAVAVGVGVFYDWAGIIQMPDSARLALKDIAGVFEPHPTSTPRIIVAGQGSAPEITNLVNSIFEATTVPTPTDTETPEPTATPTPEPTFTPTPIPPLDPQVYQELSMSRLKDFASALDRWMAVNGQLGQNSSLLNDPAWKQQAQADIEDIQNTAHALAAVGPAPEQYRSIAGWFDRVQSGADALVSSYSSALQSGDPGQFTAASHAFDQIKEDLSQAVAAMQAAGWNLK